MEDIQFTKKPYLILGASGLGRELNNWISLDNNSKIEVVGFLDDNLDALVKINDRSLPRLIGPIEIEKVSKEHSMLVAISSSKIKKDLHDKASSISRSFSSYIDCRALVSPSAQIGLGSVIFPNVVLSCQTTIGELVFINCGSQIGHDAEVGDYTSIMANVDIGGGAKIGKNVLIGSGVTILPGVEIPDNVVIGAGSVVIRSIKFAEGTYFGNPAKRIL